uniref:Uncharacterized protein LOC114336331 n=1 Tax=Diabrotica virgifera virgifera TaxID=50390 RepID=A0A6P7GEF1_DIAVI
MVLIFCYFIYHILFNLHNLNEELITLINKKNNHVKKFDQINCDHCQKEIFQDMVYLFNHYLRIKQAVHGINDFYKWRVLALVFGASGVTGSSLVFIIAVRSEESLLYYTIYITSILCYYVIAEAGEDVRSKSEMLFINAQQVNWYYWNKENRNLLLMFLLVTQKPLELNCHGFLVQSREMLLKIAKIIHGFLTYYQTVSSTN